MKESQRSTKKSPISRLRDLRHEDPPAPERRKRIIDIADAAFTAGIILIVAIMYAYR